jgi:hypothetical protein
MVNPNELVISGWHISGANLYEAAKCARVLERGLIEELRSELSAITPLSSAFDAIGCHCGLGCGHSARARLAGIAQFLHSAHRPPAQSAAPLPSVYSRSGNSIDSDTTSGRQLALTSAELSQRRQRHPWTIMLSA